VAEPRCDTDRTPRGRLDLHQSALDLKTDLGPVGQKSGRSTMRTLGTLATFLLLVLSSGIRCAGGRFTANTSPEKSAYPELESDLILFRATNGRLGGDDAFSAAARIFTEIQFVGLEKWQVLSLLGPPNTEPPSLPMPADLDDPLRYYLYRDLNGLVYVLLFRDGRVREFEWHATE